MSTSVRYCTCGLAESVHPTAECPGFEADARAGETARPGAVRAAALDGIQVTTLAEVAMRRVRFAWTSRVPLESLTLIAGVPGQGKSTLTAYIAARLSRGQLDGDLEGMPSDVLIASAEDSLASVLKPRLVAADADLSRVHAVSIHRDGADLGIAIPDDLPEIAGAIDQTNARLIVVDPLLAHIPARIDGYKDQHVRIALAPIARLAEERNIAIVGIMHLNKRETSDLFSRLGGSGGFLAAARSALLVAPDPKDDAVRVVAHAKSNVAAYAPALRFKLESSEIANPDTSDPEPIRVASVVMLGESDLTVGNLLASSHKAPRNDAVAWLARTLATGPVPVEWIRKGADEQGLAWRTVERAKRDLGVRSDRIGGLGEKGSWTWTLP